MNLEQWCRIDESLHSAESDERFKQFAGFKYSEETIQRLATIRQQNAELFLGSFSEPRLLYLNTLESIADSKTKNLELKLHKARNEKIISSKNKFGKAYVNWSTWRQFNSTQKDHIKRKQVYDEFILKTRFISPIIEKRFNSIKKVYMEHGFKKSQRNRGNTVDRKYFHRGKSLTPLDAYLESENISYSQLMQFIKSMGQRAKKPFRQALKEISYKVLQRDAEYYDDFYFFRNKVYADVEDNFATISPIAEVKKVLKKMQFESKIHFDTENRPGKYPSPICFFVRIPKDIRVLYKTESPYFDLQGCFHETGHAIHASSIDPRLQYWNKYGFSMGIAETFSIFLERLTKNTIFLQKNLQIKNISLLSDIAARNNFMELFFITFYTANSLMKAEFWRKNLTIDQASTLYSKLIKEYTGFEVPGQYWMLHHILPEAIMYVPSYILAAVRATELDYQLKNKFGEEWWTETESGRYIREIMRPGALIDLEKFSKLDSSAYMKEITA